MFALGTPLWQSRKTLHEWKDNSLLAKNLAAWTSCLRILAVSELFEPQVQNNRCFSRTAAHIFVSPGDAPAIITQYVAWMERQFNACQTPSSMYLSIFNSFRVIRCLIQCVSPTRGQSNLTKSASLTGAHSPVRGHPRGSKVVPLNSWGIGFPIFHSNYRPRMHRLATVHARDNQQTNDQRRHDTAYLNKRLFY